MPRYRTKLIDRRSIAEGTTSFRFEKPDGFMFKPGQHIDLELENPPRLDEKGMSRDLSIASAPYEPFIEIASRDTPSAFKEYLRAMPLGSEVTLKGPGGDFMLHDDASKPAVFLVGGIGITPARSMILHATYGKLARKLLLFYSNESPRFAAYLDDLQKAAEENKEFTLIGTMTRMDPNDLSWKGERGYITAALVQKYLPNFHQAVFYLSGAEEMVKEMRRLLETIGVIDLSIRTEEFPGY